ncbi:MAG: acetyl-CoA carboxylase, carboxyltransferase subunit beta [Phycisphaerales bacterium]|nr:acetyl-CoA carboxylase, carboxyltransferase subunit beta [Phycisphaerales bacterium]
MTQTQTAGRSWTELKPARKASVPEGLWLRCPGCAAMIYRRQVEASLNVCPECGHHFRISARQRVAHLTDTGTFTRLFDNLDPTDPLSFEDLKKYPDRIAAERAKSGADEGVLAGEAFIKGRPVMLACLDLTFMMGSMGCVVGEVLTRSIEHAIDRDLPLVIVSCSGGARMQEAALSLMQMAKTSAALARLDDAGGMFISVLTDPTTGGVTASFAMLGDIILAEPEALIGFAGPRVIKQTIRQDLPAGFQRSEFLLARGLVDRVVKRSDLRDEIARIIDYTG